MLLPMMPSMFEGHLTLEEERLVCNPRVTSPGS